VTVLNTSGIVRMAACLFGAGVLFDKFFATADLFTLNEWRA
jgi:hypothetical protein